MSVYYMHSPILSTLPQFLSHEKGVKVILTLYMRKLGLSGVKRLCQGHKDSKWYIYDMNPVCCFQELLGASNPGDFNFHLLLSCVHHALRIEYALLLSSNPMSKC